MNIWIVNHYAIPPSMGGLVRHYYFSKYLKKKGHSVKIFTSSKIHNTDINMIKDKSLYKEEMMDDVEYTFVRSKNYSGNGIDRIINMADLPFKMWKTMKIFWKKEKPDVIYTSSPDLFVAFFALVFGKKRKVPVVVEIRDLWPESIVVYNRMSRTNPVIQLLYQLEKWIYKRADRLIFTMEGGKDYIREKKWDKKIDLEKIFHINNGIDLEEFEHNLNQFKVNDSELEDDANFKVVYTGSVRMVNHLQTLIDVADILKKEGRNNIRIIIYGEGTEREKLEKQSREKKLNVFFRGRVEKKYIPYIVSKANLNLINVKTSSLIKYGGSWNKLFEYMAGGRPILSNLPGNYDLIKEYNMGISETFANAQEYAKQIVEIAELNEKNYREMCDNARRASLLFDYKKHTNDLEKIFIQLLNN